MDFDEGLSESSDILRPFNKIQTLPCITILLVGAETIDKHGLAKYLLKTKAPYALQIRLANKLPLPKEKEEDRPRIDFICFLIDLLSRESMKVIHDSLRYLDPRYFVGKCCFIALNVGRPSERGIHLELVSNLAETCCSPLLFGDFQEEEEGSILAGQVLTSAEIGSGLKRHMSPLFLKPTKPHVYHMDAEDG